MSMLSALDIAAADGHVCKRRGFRRFITVSTSRELNGCVQYPNSKQYESSHSRISPKRSKWEQTLH